MFPTLKLSALVLTLGLLAGCTHDASFVAEPLQPKPGEPSAWLIGSLGPRYGDAPASLNQRLLFRKRGSEYGAAGIWIGGDAKTPQDVVDKDGTASVFVLPLKPGDYEFYDYQFYSVNYQPGLGTVSMSRMAREKFNLPMHLEAGKAYYIGEFRSACMQPRCMFMWRDQMARDGAIASRQHPQMPSVQFLPLPLKGVGPFLIEGAATEAKAPVAAQVSP